MAKTTAASALLHVSKVKESDVAHAQRQETLLEINVELLEKLKAQIKVRTVASSKTELC